MPKSTKQEAAPGLKKTITKAVTKSPTKTKNASGTIVPKKSSGVSKAVVQSPTKKKAPVRKPTFKTKEVPAKKRKAPMVYSDELLIGTGDEDYDSKYERVNTREKYAESKFFYTPIGDGPTKKVIYLSKSNIVYLLYESPDIEKGCSLDDLDLIERDALELFDEADHSIAELHNKMDLELFSNYITLPTLTLFHPPCAFYTFAHSARRFHELLFTSDEKKDCIATMQGTQSRYLKEFKNCGYVSFNSTVIEDIQNEQDDPKYFGICNAFKGTELIVDRECPLDEKTKILLGIKKKKKETATKGRKPVKKVEIEELQSEDEEVEEEETEEGREEEQEEGEESTEEVEEAESESGEDEEAGEEEDVGTEDENEEEEEEEEHLVEVKKKKGAPLSVGKKVASVKIAGKDINARSRYIPGPKKTLKRK